MSSVSRRTEAVKHEVSFIAMLLGCLLVLEVHQVKSAEIINDQFIYLSVYKYCIIGVLWFSYLPPLRTLLRSHTFRHGRTHRKSVAHWAGIPSLSLTLAAAKCPCSRVSEVSLKSPLIVMAPINEVK